VDSGLQDKVIEYLEDERNYWRAIQVDRMAWLMRDGVTDHIDLCVKMLLSPSRTKELMPLAAKRLAELELQIIKHEKNSGNRP